MTNQQVALIVSILELKGSYPKNIISNAEKYFEWLEDKDLQHNDPIKYYKKLKNKIKTKIEYLIRNAT